MTTPTSSISFLDMVVRSGLMTQKQIDAELGPRPPADPNQCAAALVKAERLTAYQAKQLLTGRFRGFVLGPYKILRPLGQGGMGTVFLGEHTELDRKVAIKVLPTEKAKDDLSLERFKREGRAAAALDHPNIMKLFDISQGGGVHFLVLEYVEGKDLESFVAETGPLHYAQAAQYVAQAAAGLQHAHDKGFIHRDIKPANLMVGRNGVVKILDMGLARSFAAERDNLTAALGEGEISGTADFLSPEQAMGKVVDERSDIYSLGATFYALVTGQPPFAGTVAQKLAQHQMREPPRAADKLRGRLPEGLSDVICKMMAKRPADRYQTGTEVVDALAPWLPAQTTGSVVLDPPSGNSLAAHSRPRGSAGGPVWKRPAAVAGAGVGLLLVGLVLVLALGGGKAGPVAQNPEQAKPDQPPRNQPGDRPKPPPPTHRPAAADARFRLVAFGSAANVPAAGPLFAQFPNDKLDFERWGELTVLDVPFLIPNPSDVQPNIITLYGPKSEPTRALPHSARVPVNASVRKLHFLSGVSAWGWPCESPNDPPDLQPIKGSVTLIARLHYADKATEDHEWRNGEQFADYAGRNDVSGSEFAFLTPNRKQVRYLSLTPRRADQTVEAVEFIKGENDATCPAVIAMTIERSAGDDPKRGGPAEGAGPSSAAPRTLIRLDLKGVATEFVALPEGRSGTQVLSGVTFDLLDSKGGPRANVVRPGDDGTKVPCFLAAKAVHILGCAPPDVGDGQVVGRIRLLYAGGATEAFDWKCEPAVTAEDQKLELPNKNRARYFVVRPSLPGVVQYIVFEKSGATTALVIGITVETV